jgi:hypothetical protein
MHSLIFLSIIHGIPQYRTESYSRDLFIEIVLLTRVFVVQGKRSRIPYTLKLSVEYPIVLLQISQRYQLHPVLGIEKAEVGQRPDRFIVTIFRVIIFTKEDVSFILWYLVDIVLWNVSLNWVVYVG